MATGGDTLLGRTMARAVLADQQRSAQADAVPVAPVPSAAPASALPDAAAAAFVRAFAAALAQGDAGSSGSGSGSRDGLPSPDAGLARAPVPADAAAQPASPFALAIGVHHASPIEPGFPTLPAVPAAPHVDPSAVVDQILRGMQIHTADGQSEVRLRLMPEQLGDVSVKLIVSGGSVDATLTANSAAARDALAGGQSQLARTLADAGLKLQSFSVGLAGGGLGGQRDRSDSNHHAWASPRRAASAASGRSSRTNRSTSSACSRSPSFGPPVFTANRFRGHNYLA